MTGDLPTTCNLSGRPIAVTTYVRVLPTTWRQQATGIDMELLVRHCHSLYTRRFETIGCVLVSHRQCTAGHNDDDGNFALLSEVRRKGRKVEERGEVWEGKEMGGKRGILMSCRQSAGEARTLTELYQWNSESMPALRLIATKFTVWTGQLPGEVRCCCCAKTNKPPKQFDKSPHRLAHKS